MIGIRTARLGLAVGLVAASWAVALPTGASAEEEGEFMKRFLGSIGIIPEDKPAIEYRERAPLVLPPRLDLRDPVAAGSVQSRNAQWPNDPDVAAERRRDAEARLPAGLDEKSRGANSAAPLSPEEMRAGRRPGAQLNTGAAPTAKDTGWMHPDTLREQYNNRRVIAEQDEGGRRRLTDPPTGYRQSATGKKIEKAFDAPVTEDVSRPGSFHREQWGRR
jgi:hypothetical protein